MRDEPLDVARGGGERRPVDEGPDGPTLRRAPLMRVASCGRAGGVSGAVAGATRARGGGRMGGRRAVEVGDGRGGESCVALEEERRFHARGREHRLRLAVAEELLAQVGPLAVDDARAGADGAAARGGRVGDEPRRLGAAHHRDLQHPPQDLRHLVGVLHVEEQQPEVAAEEGVRGRGGRARRRRAAEQVGEHRLRRRQPRGGACRPAADEGGEKCEGERGEPAAVPGGGNSARREVCERGGGMAAGEHAEAEELAAKRHANESVRKFVERQRGVPRDYEG